ncbi:hypothetical protein ACSBR2_042818 [Camellia fascicularis]
MCGFPVALGFFFLFFFFFLVKACENCWRASSKIRIKKRSKKDRCICAEAVWLVKLTAVFLGNGTSHGFLLLLLLLFKFIYSGLKLLGH